MAAFTAAQQQAVRRPTMPSVGNLRGRLTRFAARLNGSDLSAPEQGDRIARSMSREQAVSAGDALDRIQGIL